MPLTPQDFAASGNASPHARSRPIRNISLTCAIWWDTKRRTTMTPPAPASASRCAMHLRRSSRAQAIALATKKLVEQRHRWLNAEGLNEAEKKKRTLTNLYNARPTWLDLAHKRLDEAVFAAYGWKSDLSDEEILEKLLSLNLERSKAGK